MRPPLFPVFILLLLATPAAAQSPDSRAKDPRLNVLRGIVLTPVQQATVDSLDAALAAHTKEADARSNSAGEVMVRLQERLKARDSAIRAILTPGQLIVYRRNVDSLHAWAARERH